MSSLAPWLARSVVAAVACSVLPAALVAQSATVSFDPDQSKYALDPGQTQLVKATVCLPGVPVKADIYLLADVTTSMWPVLDQLKLNAADIVNALLATSGADIEVGVGSYRDFPFDPKPFMHQVSPTKNAQSLVDAINTWTPAGGGDVSEGQFYALYKLATDPAVGFRPDAKRIILWFGDSPGHDPICSIFNGLGVPTFSIDEALVESSLHAAGASGGTAVIAVSTSTSQFFPLGLNDNPQADAKDYLPFCSIGGLPGQADRIAQATGGISTTVDDPPQVVQAILDAVDALLVKASVSCGLAGDIAPFVKSITPPQYDNVVLPADPLQQVCVEFDILLEGPPCAKAGQFFHGQIDVSVNQTLLASKELGLQQPYCNALKGQLWLGPRRLTPPQILPKGGPGDMLLILPTMIVNVDLQSLPIYDIPDNPALAGLSIYAQCGLYDKLDFPKDTVKTSNGVQVTFNDPGLGRMFGDESGLELSQSKPAMVGGTLELRCSLSQNP